MLTERLAVICIFLLVTGPSLRLFAGPPARSANAEAAPAGGDDLSDPSRRLLLFSDEDEDDDHDGKPQAPGTPSPVQSKGRYFLGLLDHRSSYGKDFFPDPFLGPEFDQETQVEVDYLHGERGGQREDEGDAAFEWNVVDQLTLAGEVGYDSEHQPKIPGGGADKKHDRAENGRGFENVDLAGYHPIFEAISKDGTLDYTAAARLDVGIPTHTAVSGTDVQLTPYLGQLLRVGEHVSVEAWTGSQLVLGSHQTDQFIYGTTFGYRISRHQLPLPLTRTVTPMLEFDGTTPFSNHGRNALFGVAGWNWQFTGKGDFQPRVGIGYEFPVDQGARDQLRWGVITQVIFEF